eukprot:9328219-Lingulodinium_polyedra.AAC.1
MHTHARTHLILGGSKHSQYMDAMRLHASTVAVGHCKDGGNNIDSSSLSFSTDSRAGSHGNSVSRLPHLAT